MIIGIIQSQNSTVTPPPNRIWVHIYDQSSEPQVSLGILISSQVASLNAQWPPNNHPIGSTAALMSGDNYRVYQIQEE